MHCREITSDFFYKVSLAREDALRHTVSFRFVYVLLDLSIPYRKNIQSPAVTRCRNREHFVTRFKVEGTDHIPGDCLVTLFSFGRFIRQENLSYRLLKNGSNIIAIFPKSTYSVPASTNP